MNFQKIFWGIVLLLLGFLMLFEHLEVFNIRWWYLIHFWPVIFILWGVTILPIKNTIKAIATFSIIIITIIAVAYISHRKPEKFRDQPGIIFRHHNDTDEEWDDPYFDADSSTIDI